MARCCSRCGVTGHNIRSCPSPDQAEKAPRQVGDSASDRAAAHLAEHGGTTRASAELFGVTHQAVQQAWNRLFPGRLTPAQAERARNAERAVELARGGLHAAEIGRRLGINYLTVTRACAAAGQELETGRRPSAQMEAALAAVAGGAFVAEAAAEHGVGYSNLARTARARGISGGRGLTRVTRDGRGVRAAQRVLAGESMTDACRAERTSPPTVRAILARMRARAEHTSTASTEPSGVRPTPSESASRSRP